MKFYHIKARELIDYPDSENPTYAVLSHTWEAREVPASPHLSASLAQPLMQKLEHACEIATLRGIECLWADFICVDKTSPFDLEEAISGSFRRLANADICFAHLDDLPPGGELFNEEEWSICEYWKRAWTLQELILPPKVEFYDSRWNRRGCKVSTELLPVLSNITGIPQRVLLNPIELSKISLAKRMSWAAGRYSRREEDVAYSLAAITGVVLQVRYGEGAERSFMRLQEEILHDTRDGSIFAWRSDSPLCTRGLLAKSPSEFRHFSENQGPAWQEPWLFRGKVWLSSKGVHIESYVIQYGSCIVLEIGKQGADSPRSIGIRLRQRNGVYERVDTSSETIMPNMGRLQSIELARGLEFWANTKMTGRLDTVEVTEKGMGSKFRASATLCTVSSPPSDRATPSSDNFQPILGPMGLKGGRSEDSDVSLLEDVMDKPISPQGLKTEPRIRSYSADIEDEDSLSFSDDYSDSEFDSDSEISDTPGCSLDADPEFQQILGSLIAFMYSKVQVWMTSTGYIAPPDSRSSPHKRVKFSRPRCEGLTEDDLDDDGFVVVCKPGGYFRFACPYYILDPATHQDCLRRYDFQSVQDLTKHLRRRHRQPIHCFVCFRIFDHARDRDEHVRAGPCTPRRVGQIEGLDDRQMAWLSKRDRVNINETTRWLRLWNIVSPGASMPRSPYLLDGVGLGVSKLRDYWASCGSNHLAQYVENVKILGKFEAKNWSLVRKVVFKYLLNKVMEDSSADNG